ncbi:hypothetical protein [Lysobacter tyrosinilyticus]
MNTLVQPRQNQSLLRRAFTLDAIATGGLGLGLAIAAEPLQPWLGLPVGLLREAGFICVAFAAILAYALTRPLLTQWMARFAIGVNAVWILASFGLLLSGWGQPTTLGVTFVIAQVLAVVVFAELQYLGMKRAQRA